MSGKNTLTFPSSYHKIAWFRDNTLQSKIQLFEAGLLLATERPIFTRSVKGTLLSSKGWELGLEVKIPIAILLHSSCSSRRLMKYVSWQRNAHEQIKFAFSSHVISTPLSLPSLAKNAFAFLINCPFLSRISLIQTCDNLKQKKSFRGKRNR